MQKDLIKVGDKIGNMEVIKEPIFEFMGRKVKRWYVLCQCICTNEKYVRIDSWLNGRYQSCGCLRAKNSGLGHRTGTLAKNGIKKCSTCEIFKTLDNFNKKYTTVDGYRCQCKDCEIDYRLKKFFGISLNEFNRIFGSQGYVCAICGSNKSNGPYESFSVDHCHQTGKVRGILCNPCNMALGTLGDSVELLNKAIEYLTKNS